MNERVAGQEEYLEQLYRLSPSGTVQLSTLAKALSVTGPSVTGMCRTLARKGLASYTPHQGVTLTDAGRGQAKRILRRHRLAERLLTDLIGLPWAEAHAEACKLEHVISDRVERLLAETLPDTCPHGNPIDGDQDDSVVLVGLTAGQEAEVVRVEREDTDVLRYLAELGLVPGATVTLVNQAPHGGPLLITVAGAHYAVGQEIAERVYVRRRP